MSEPTLAAQRFAVLTMRGHGPLTAICPAANIIDRNTRPEVFPLIDVGLAHATDDSATCIVAYEVYLDIHVWTKENTMADVKSISGEVIRALRDASGTQDGFALDINFETSEFMRDPSGEHSHGVLTFRILAEDLVRI